MVRQWQQLHHGERYSHTSVGVAPDFVALAKAFGWDARRVHMPASLGDALDHCLSSSGPFLLDGVVAPQENCFPMIPSGHGHNEVLLGVGRPFTTV